MPVDSETDLAELLHRLQLVSAEQLSELRGDSSVLMHDSDSLVSELKRRGWLTSFQAAQLLAGRGPDLLLGNYVLLDELGEGGMGRVFKARHRRMGRVVALKAIAPEKLEDPDSLSRFLREIEAAAQLEHPNVVRAYDADQAGETHFFVMEYVDGIDLGKWVLQNGPLPIERACDYIRQAALGLQHAHERGLVHRDIKPSNLLLNARDDTVKLLDLGLARLNRRANGEGALPTLTCTGQIMGTPDFIAPEQARDTHTADIRADLYSLGCTLYFLLTARAPFPIGSMLEKLLKHQLDTPTPLERLRPETPPQVVAVVNRLMAKHPENRYQTPAEAAAALAPLSGGSTRPAAPPTVQIVPPPAAPSTLARMQTSSKQSTVNMRAPDPKANRPRRRLPLAVFSVLLVALAVLTAWKLKALLRHDTEANAPRGDADVRVSTGSRSTNDSRSTESPEQAAAAFKKLQAIVSFARDREHAPVVSVDCTGLKIGDADLVHLEALPELEKLFLFDTPIGDAGLAHVRKMSHLKYLGLSKTAVTNAGLEHLRELPQLEELWLDRTSIGNAGLSHLEGLTRLRRLHLGGTRITDTGLPHLKGLVQLRRLDLRETRVGSGLGNLSGLIELQSLDLGNTRIEDVDLAHLTKAANLRNLNLSRTGIRDAGLNYLASLRQLQTLDLGSTKVSEDGVEKLQQALPTLKIAR
jgi:serine/threonine protein kinase